MRRKYWRQSEPRRGEVKLYLDSSAIVKLVRQEKETAALRRFLKDHSGDTPVTSALARVEVIRAVTDGGPSALAHARRQLSKIDQVVIDNDLLDSAANLSSSPHLRSLDAVHLASARLLGSELRAVVTYDQRMSAAAEALAMVVALPT
ncbi:MAG: type II toxin-antitoxin system VapC family toxin [Actinomycetota bacterium]